MTKSGLRQSTKTTGPNSRGVTVNKGPPLQHALDSLPSLELERERGG